MNPPFPRTFSALVSVLVMLTAARVSDAATYTVTSTNRNGAGSLLQAILDANANAGADSIHFNVTDGFSINPTNALPTITDPVTIDGSTQPGFAGAPLIELNGTGAGTAVDGLRIASSNCVIRALVINRFAGDGIEITNGGFNVVEGCYIGLSLAGSTDQGNTLNGVLITNSANNTIGGLDITNRNYISGNNQSGINMSGANSTNNVVVGNVIGLNLANSAVGNSSDGIRVLAPANRIGGSLPGARNIISGNTGDGIEVTGGGNRGNVIVGNFIGLDPSGILDRGNSVDGIFVNGAGNTMIGGTNASNANLIAGNTGDGIELNGVNATNTMVMGNWIGTDVSGAAAAANSGNGILITTSARANFIGGIGVGQGNVIAFNTQDGVAIAAAVANTNNAIRGNSIHSNGQLGLDLGNNGITANDAGDTDTGANNLQNVPILLGVTNTPSGVVIAGAVSARTNAQCVLDFYANTIPDSSGSGEGQFLIGSTNLFAGPTGTTNFLITFTSANLFGRYVSATTTDAFGNTSEFATNTIVVSTVPGNVFTVINTNDAGSGSLRQAILDANTSITVGDRIEFAITNPVATIFPSSPLPAITDPVTIDGYTQPGSATNSSPTVFNGTLQVRLDGSGAGASANGLSFISGENRVRGLVIIRFAQNGISLSGGGNSVIEGNIIGLDTDSSDLGNALDGLLVLNSSGNLIGGTNPAACNVISGNNSDGITISGTGSSNNVVAGNLIGTDLTGTVDRGNSFDGVVLSAAPGNTIGGLTPLARNIISGNNSDGVSLSSAGSSNNVIIGNYIGTDVTGSLDLGNSLIGVFINNVPFNTIGGTVAGAGNLVSGNNDDGISISTGSATGNVVQGNLIGTDATGTFAIKNQDNGIVVSAAPGNSIGGSIPGARNLISGNENDGIELNGVASFNNVIEGNWIGTDLTGQNPVPNASHGIQITTSAHDNSIGAGNIIAFNSLDGVFVASGTNNSIRQNSIFFNGGLGIDLGADGILANDPGDADSGANQLQNTPELTAATNFPGSVIIAGTLSSRSNVVYALDFFANPAFDPSGSGEGQNHIGTTNVTTDAAGQISFTVTFPAVLAGRFITATATDPFGNTSEFSTWISAASTVPVTNIVVTTTNDAGPGSLRDAIGRANAHVSAGNDLITFAIPGPGPHIISPITALPAITDRVTIDGYTQTGASTNSLCSSNNAVLRIQINGTAAGVGTDGFRLTGVGNSIVRGLSIVNFRGDGIEISGGTNNQVAGCFIGIGLDGQSIAGNSAMGVNVVSLNTSANRIGGGSPGERNVISGNLNGILINGSSANVIAGNFIGLDYSGTLDCGNTNSGIVFSGVAAAGNTIGGTNGCSRNVISGNGSATFSEHHGINIISAPGTAVIGNYVGLNAQGTVAVGNGATGIRLAGASSSVIGGSTSERNVVSGNSYGIQLESTSTSNVVSGNFIGTDVTGTLDRGNSLFGIFLLGASHNLIDANVVSGNDNDAIYIAGNSAPFNRLIRNFIGTDITGAFPIGNSGAGVRCEQSDTIIGGTNAIEANIIAFNSGVGVAVSFGDVRVPILGNSIHNNGSIGIDLNGLPGVDANDPGDSDSGGGNNGQNYPVLMEVLKLSTATVVSGSLNSASNAVFRLEFFNNAAADPTGFGEGQTYLAFTNVTTDASGNAAFVYRHPVSLPSGNYITATATDSADNTSEFSAAGRIVPIESVNLGVTLVDSADPAPHFTNFFYTITVTNAGPTNATGVVAIHTLPGALSFVSATPSQGSCTHTSGVVTCSLGVINKGAIASVVVRVSSSTTTSVVNQVSVSAAQLDYDTNNNSAVQSTFLGVANLAVDIADLPDPVVAGHFLTNIVSVTNLGPDTATGVVLDYQIDSTEVVVGASISQGGFVQNGNSFACNFGSILPGNRVTFTVVSIPTESGTVASSSFAAPKEAEPDFLNNSPVEFTQVLDGPGVFRLSATELFVSEGVGTAVLTVQRSGGSIGTVGVSYATSNLTAIAGSDYTATTGVLTFTNGEVSRTFTVPITDDLAFECNELFRARIHTPTGGALALRITNVLVYIYDNDIAAGGVVTGMSVVSTNPGAATGDGHSFGQDISSDGNRVVFVSYATNLVPVDADSDLDVFVRDIASGAILLASIATNGISATGESGDPRLSASGRYVAFYSFGNNLVSNDTNMTSDVFLRDTFLATTTLISVNQSGSGPGNGDAFGPRITPDGRFVVFVSSATNLATNDVNGIIHDVFIRDTLTNRVELVSRSGAGSANAASRNPSVSDNGRFIAFESLASNLGPTDTNNRFDIYVRDRLLGTNILISRNLAGVSGGNETSRNPSISGNGQVVVFSTLSTNLTSGDTNMVEDIFAYNLATHSLQLVSATPSGQTGNGESVSAGISADGRYVAFESAASNLVPNDLNGQRDVFVRDLVAGTTALVSVNCEGSSTGNDASTNPRISLDGKFVVFQSRAWDLTPGNYSDFSQNIFRRNLQSGTTVLVSQDLTLTGAGNDDCYEARISAAGFRIVFGSTASDLIQNDLNVMDDVFAWQSSDVPALIDLVLGKTVSTNNIGEGFNFNYTIAVTNLGFAPASGVSITDVLPAGTAFVSATSSQGTVTNSSGTVVCSVGTLGVGAGASMNIIVTAAAQGPATNTAVATATESDVSPANNTDTVLVNITPIVRPVITVIRTNSQLSIRWPSSTPPVFAVETTTNITPPITWIAVTNTISDNGAFKSVLVNITNEPRRFYRLRK